MPSDQETARRRLILIAGILIIGLILIVSIASFLSSYGLRLASTNPANKALVSVDSIIIMNFNKPIKGTPLITVSPEVPGVVKVNGKEVLYLPLERFQDQTDYTVTIKEAESENGRKLTDRKFGFTAYQPRSAGEFDAAQKDNLKKATEQPFKERLQLKYPFLAKLKYDDQFFGVDYEVTNIPVTNKSFKYPGVTIVIDTRVTNIAGPRPHQGIIDEQSANRDKAIAWIRAQGYDPDNDFIVRYSSNLMQEKYGSN